MDREHPVLVLLVPKETETANTPQPVALCWLPGSILQFLSFCCANNHQFASVSVTSVSQKWLVTVMHSVGPILTLPLYLQHHKNLPPWSFGPNIYRNNPSQVHWYKWNQFLPWNLGCFLVVGQNFAITIPDSVYYSRPNTVTNLQGEICPLLHSSQTLHKFLQTSPSSQHSTGITHKAETSKVLMNNYFGGCSSLFFEIGSQDVISVAWDHLELKAILSP